jgi:predicted alpha/beta-hydrolase family hydrolase
MPRVAPFSDASGPEPVRGFLHTPDTAATPVDRGALVLTHSAGADCNAPLLVALADAFASAGVAVLRCDLPFRQQRPTGPPLRTAARDQAGLHAAIDAVRRAAAPRHIFLGGHSYGGRMASMLAADSPGLADALLLLSYPLHPPRQPQQLRTKHFPQLRTPTLFVSGTHDGFASIPELQAALALIPAQKQLLPIEGAGHDLYSKAARETLPRLIPEAFQAFIEKHRVSGI